MDTSGRAWQWYGYAVCLIAVITGLLCLSAVINNAFELARPVGSYETYDAMPREPADTTSEAARRARFEAMRTDRIAERRFHAMKGMVTSAVLLAVAIALFAMHWRWLQRGRLAGAEREAA